MAAALILELDLLLEHVNVLMESLDPKHYQEAQELKAKLSEHFPVYKDLSSINRLFYEGREVLWNVQSVDHFDKQDQKMPG